MTNYMAAKKIIESGMKYMSTKLAGYDVKLWEVKDAIAKFTAGKKRYTSKEIERLKHIFNRSRMRANAYKKTTVNVDRVVTNEGAVLSMPYKEKVTLGRASQTPDQQAVGLAKTINKMLKPWDSLESNTAIWDMIYNAVTTNFLPLNPWKNGKLPDQVIDTFKITAADVTNLLNTFAALKAIETISLGAKKIIQKYFDEVLAQARVIDMPETITRAIMAQKLKKWTQDHVYDSDTERDTSTQVYEAMRDNPDKLAEIYGILATVNTPQDLEKSLKELTKRG